MTTVSPDLIAGMYCFCAYGRSWRSSTPSANVRFLALPARSPSRSAAAAQGRVERTETRPSNGRFRSDSRLGQHFLVRYRGENLLRCRSALLVMRWPSGVAISASGRCILPPLVTTRPVPAVPERVVASRMATMRLPTASDACRVEPTSAKPVGPIRKTSLMACSPKPLATTVRPVTFGGEPGEMDS